MAHNLTHQARHFAQQLLQSLRGRSTGDTAAADDEGPVTVLEGVETAMFAPLPGIEVTHIDFGTQ
jgi:hypothetical protein